MRRCWAPVVLAMFASWPAADADAAGPEKIHRVGMLCADWASAAVASKVFVAEMARLGFVEGKNLVLDRAGRSLQAPALAASAAALVARRVDVLTSWCGTSGAVASKEAAQGIPVVFSSSADPVALGLVSSLARPGGNVTGFSAQAFDLARKRLEHLALVKPGIKRVAIVHHESSRHLPWYDGYRAALEQAAQRLRIAIQFASIPDAARLDAEFGRLVKDGVDAVSMLGGIETPNNFGQQAASMALKYRLPSAGATGVEPASASALTGFTDNSGVTGQRMARYVARILAGTKPGDLPVEQVDPPGLSIDLRVANALGLTIPPSLLLRATEVIE